MQDNKGKPILKPYREAQNREAINVVMITVLLVGKPEQNTLINLKRL